MKNRVIKKIMAYLLVGAMVITTPMTASATESVLQEAYGLDQSGAGEDNGKNTGTGTGTGTGTNTNTGGTEIIDPIPVPDKIASVLGVTLDKTDLELKVGNKGVLQARAIVDDYDPSGEVMEWLTPAEKEAIEQQIVWYSENNNIASIEGAYQGNSAVVSGVSEGQTRVCAWIEADNISDSSNVLKPTNGDFIAWATVTVTNDLTLIVFDQEDNQIVASKRQYDLREYTNLYYGENTEPKRAIDQTQVKLTYSIENYLPDDKQVKATVTESGILKVTKALKNADTVDEDLCYGKLKIRIMSDEGVAGEGTIILTEPNPVTGIEKIGKQKLDLGFMGEAELNQSSNYKNTLKTGKIKIKTQKNKTTFSADSSTTDDFVWTSNKPAIAVVSPSSVDKREAIITAKGVGTAKITVKASSGKSASFNVTVYATPTTVELPSELETYTGKPKTVTAILKGDQGQPLPVGTTALKWEIAKVANGSKTVNNPFAKISAKKDVATIKPVDFLKGVDKKYPESGEDTAVVTITKVTYKSNQDNKSQTLALNSNPSTTVKITQSSLKKVSLDVYKNEQGNDGDLVKAGIGTTESKKSITDKKNCYVGQKYFTIASGVADKGSLASIAWTVSGKGVDPILNDEDATLLTIFKSNAKTTIKASYITITDQTKGKIKKTTQTINITPIQNATSIAFAKPIVVKNPIKNNDAKKTQSVKFDISNVAPNKKANYGEVVWKVKVYDGEKEITDTENYIKKVKIKGVVSAPNGKSATIDVPGNLKEGSVIKVGAYTTTGLTAYGYIYITEQTTKVIPNYSQGTITNGVIPKTGLEINSKDDDVIVLSAKLDTKVWNDSIQEKKPNQEHSSGALPLGTSTTSYKTEPISFSLDKKSATIIRVKDDGTVIPLRPGKATVTIKTLSGKKATVKINVNSLEPKKQS